MFQNLRQNSTIYILHKGTNIHLENGCVTNVTQPRAKYGLPQNFSTEMVVDITANINGNIVNYTMLPAQLDIADTCLGADNIVISDNKDAIISEIYSLKQKSENIINSIENHKNIIESCDKILQEINPEYQYQSEINEIKLQMQVLTDLIKDLKK